MCTDILTFEQYDKLEKLANEICLAGKADILQFNTSHGLNILNTLTSGSPEGDIKFVGAKIGEALISELSLYRNKLNPVLHNYINSVKDMIGGASGRTKAEAYEIKEIAVPRLVQDADSLGLFKDRLVTGEIVASNDYPKDIPCVDIKDITLRETELNGYVEEMITQEDRLYPLRYFEIMRDAEVTPLINVIKIEDLVKAWLIAKYVKENKLAELGMSERKMNNVIDVLASRINIAIEAIENYIKFERLYLDAKLCSGTGRTTVYVFKPVYDSCTNEIGIVDAILGMAVKDKFNLEHTYKAYILAKKDELIKIWDAYLTSSKYSDMVAEQERIRLAFTISLRNTINELPDDLKSLHEGSSDFSSLDNEVDKILRAGKLLNTDEFIEKMSVAIIANYLFNKTNYFKFFKNVEKFLGKDKKLKVDDVIPMVLTVFVVDYLMAQMKTVQG